MQKCINYQHLPCAPTRLPTHIPHPRHQWIPSVSHPRHHEVPRHANWSRWKVRKLMLCHQHARHGAEKLRLQWYKERPILIVWFCYLLHLRSPAWRRMQNLRWVGKNGSQIWSRLWTKVHVVLRRCRRHLLVPNALATCLYHISFRRYVTKVAIMLWSGQKRRFLDARFVGGWDTPDFGHAFSNRTHFQACGRFWLSSIQRVQTLTDEKWRKKEELENVAINDVPVLPLKVAWRYTIDNAKWF